VKDMFTVVVAFTYTQSCQLGNRTDCWYASRVARSLIRPAGRAGLGQKIYKDARVGSGRVQMV